MEFMNPLKQFFLELIARIYNPYLRSQTPAMITNIGGSYEYITTWEGTEYRVITTLRIRNYNLTHDGFISEICGCSAKLKHASVIASPVFGGGDAESMRVWYCPICDGAPPPTAKLTYYPCEKE